MTPRTRFMFTLILVAVTGAQALGYLRSGIAVADITASALLGLAGGVTLYESVMYGRRQVNRPRIGVIRHNDGTITRIYFIPTDRPNTFVGLTANGELARVHRDEGLFIDYLRRRHNIVIKTVDDAGRER